MEDLIKNIIINKRYFELNSEEKMLVKKYAKNEEEFEALKITFGSVYNFNEELNAKLSPGVKEKLNERFKTKHSAEKNIQWNQLLYFFFPQDRQFYQKPAFQIAAIALMVFLTIPFLWKEKTPQYAINTTGNSIEINKVEFENTTPESDRVSTENNVQHLKEVPKSTQDVVSPPPPVAVIEENTLDLGEEDVVIEEEYVLEDYMLSPQNETTISTERRVSNLSGDTRVEHAEIQKSNKKVETSETLDLLIALY
ncbi:hypothetical protein [Brumimicrobium aurantiacum]|uniref:Uncharacterized protein n=1 Tax=Brumimicrobium aurantiacum TaxID=1737063 RepID=A0A3E1EW53_9FLAO|nr:hypothetical protein [Brumimicrobium aurantiacum]RFC53794.1 hypothetical protein DXU93_11750 [Brumimicrobium aurantiacum]